jgi:hypothetical protein
MTAVSLMCGYRRRRHRVATRWEADRETAAPSLLLACGSCEAADRHLQLRFRVGAGPAPTAGEQQR